MPVPGPTMMTGAEGSSGRRKLSLAWRKMGRVAADGGALAEVAAGEALAVAAVGVVADDADGGLDVVGVQRLAGGDGVHARREALRGR